MMMAVSSKITARSSLLDGEVFRLIDRYVFVFLQNSFKYLEPILQMIEGPQEFPHDQEVQFVNIGELLVTNADTRTTSAMGPQRSLSHPPPQQII